MRSGTWSAACVVHEAAQYRCHLSVHSRSLHPHNRTAPPYLMHLHHDHLPHVDMVHRQLPELLIAGDEAVSVEG